MCLITPPLAAALEHLFTGAPPEGASLFTRTAAAATARLSWSPTADIADLAGPISQPTPLYLKLDGIQDMQALGVVLRWAPADPAEPRYFIRVDTTFAATCGRVSPDHPVGGIGADSSFTTSILFPPGSSTDCVTYVVAAGFGMAWRSTPSSSWTASHTFLASRSWRIGPASRLAPTIRLRSMP
jgi:hypothetical protein